MFVLRKLGKVLRGAATPFQVWLACILAGMLGFVPSFTRSPALVIGLTLILLIFNANLAVAGLVGLVCKLASLALMGVSFAVGRFLLDGPTKGLFTQLINAPVFAWCGFEWYACTGGLLVGMLFGVIAGYAFNLPIRGFRNTMAKVEEKSSFYQRHRGNPLVRFTFFVLFGRRHQWESYRALLEKKFGNPIRIAGVIAAALIVGGVWFGAARLSQPSIAQSIQSSLQSTNGATVDLGGVELDLGDNRLAIRDLAMADKEALDLDLFRATRLECDVSGSDLLAKRLKIGRLVARDSRHGAKRATPGVRLEPPAPATPPPGTADPEEKTLDQWIESAELWKQRLTQAKEWLDKLKRPPPSEDDETLEERLEREVALKGWRNVAANHLIEGAPLFQIGELVIDGIVSDTLGRTLDLHVENLSSDPSLVDGPPRIKITTQDGMFAFDVLLGTEARAAGQSFIDVRCANVSTEFIARELAAKSGTKVLEGGTLDAGFRVDWGAGQEAKFDTPLAVKVRDTKLQIGKLGATTVKELAIPLVVRGPLDNPRVKVELDQLADNLLRGGFTQLGQQVKDEAAKRSAALQTAVANQAEQKEEELAQKAKEAASEVLESKTKGDAKKAAKEALGDLKGSGKTSGKELGDEAKKALDGLGDLNPFGKKKKDEKKDGKKDDGNPKEPPKDGGVKPGGGGGR